MAEFFPNVTYKTKQQWVDNGKQGVWNKPSVYPDSSLASLGAAYKLSEGLLNLQPKELAIAQALRESRPDDFGVNQYLYDKNSASDRRTMSKLSDLYDRGNFTPPDFYLRPDMFGVHNLGNLFLESGILSQVGEDMQTKAAMRSLAIMDNKINKFGPVQALERWNGRGKGEGYDSQRHVDSVHNVWDALKANPDHMKSVMDAFNLGYNNPQYFTQMDGMTEAPPTYEPKVRGLIDLFRDKIRDFVGSGI